MCGILAAYSRGESSNLTKEIFSHMLAELRLRGPDEESIFHDKNAWLGHTRLSIIDLEGGGQPVFNEDRSVACILNGEIYNFMELRERLERKGHIFRTHSDTEAIVHLYEEEGENVFEYLNGMFSIVIYDSKRDALLIARDRVGEKPLLYFDTPKMFICASELKALIRNPGISNSLDVNAVAVYLSMSYIPAPLSILANVRKLEPAHYLKVTNDETVKRKYWSPQDRIDYSRNEQDFCEEWRRLFQDSIKHRMVSDVPIGAFLSGGVDSSAVVAFMAKNSTRPIKTFSVGFNDSFSELPYARQIADRYQTDHTEINIKSGIREVLPEVAKYFDEPFADNSNVPTYLISKAAREHVKVVLTGDGGDELFGGYERYLTQRCYANYRVFSKGISLLSQVAMKTTGTGWIDQLYRYQSNRGAAEHWFSIVECFAPPQLSRLCRFAFESPYEFTRAHRWLQFNARDPLSEAYAHDFNYYLPDDLLKKVDMASMAVGLESRAPFLDHRLVELSMSIPPQLKLKQNETKYLLKKSLVGILPESILRREKQGFGAPIGKWVRNELKEFIHDALSPGCKIESLFFREGIREVMDRVYVGDIRDDWRAVPQLWSLLMLELWMKEYV